MAGGETTGYNQQEEGCGVDTREIRDFRRTEGSVAEPSQSALTVPTLYPKAWHAVPHPHTQKTRVRG